VNGRCVDMPSVPAQQDFKDKVHARAYRTAERGGVFWVYMGPQDSPPALPMIEAAMLDASELDVMFVQRDCNWLQALEGDIDTSHFGFLHAGHLQPEEVPKGHPLEYTSDERAPDYHVTDAPWGTYYGAFRQVQTEAGPRTYWRFANFMFPFWTQTPQGEFARHVNARAWVPLDDTHTMTIHFRWRKGAPSSALPLKNGQPLGGSAPAPEYLPDTSDWLGRYRIKAGEANDWLMDREAQRSNRIYSGIDHIPLQDQAVTESMGAITDHSFEHLGPGDLMIARTRRRALKAARAFAQGAPAPGVQQPEVFMGARSGYFLAAPQTDWREAYRAQVRLANRPAGLPDAVPEG
jgi:phthalate 4,5-dioxygenase